MNITGCLAANNQTGVYLQSITSNLDAAVRIAYSTVTGNERGLVDGGVITNIYSLGNNLVHGNRQDVFGGQITVISGTLPPRVNYEAGAAMAPSLIVEGQSDERPLCPVL